MHTTHVRLRISNHTSKLWQCNTVLEDVVTCITEEVNIHLDSIVEEVSIDTDVQLLSNLPLQVVSTLLLLNNTLTGVSPCGTSVVVDKCQVWETRIFICNLVVTCKTVRTTNLEEVYEWKMLLYPLV